MRLKLRHAAESISFQKGELFQDLTRQIQLIRDDQKITRLSAKSFFKQDAVVELSHIIRKHTGLDINITDSGFQGPCIYPPQLTANHVFNDPDTVEMYEQWDPTYSSQSHSEAALRSLNKPVIKGTIDLKNGRVTGAFERMQCLMMLPMTFVIGKTRFTPEEVAAVTLHETGHAFTFMEFISRSATTNQALAGMSRYLDKSVSQEQRTVMFARAADAMKLDAEKAKALKECKTPETLTTILLDRDIERSTSELGRSIYDVNTAEYLADQFAARQGAGVALTTALDKIYRDYGQTRNAIIFSELFMITLDVTMTVLAFTAGSSIALCWLGLTFFSVIFTNKEDEIYDNPAARFSRIRQQLVQQLKDDHLSDEGRVVLVEQLERLDEINKNGAFVDKLSIFSGLAYFFKPGYRAAHKYEMLQKELEQLGNNEAFVQASRLKTMI
jgi:hypothetical protein